MFENTNSMINEIPEDATLRDMILWATVFSGSMNKELKSFKNTVEGMEFQENAGEWLNDIIDTFISMSEINSDLMQECMKKVREENNG